MTRRCVLIGIALAAAACERSSPAGAGGRAVSAQAAGGGACDGASGPVCGADGRTYADDCARAAASAATGHLGPCETRRDCEGACTAGAARCSGAGSQACVLRDGCGAWAEAEPCGQGCDLATGRCRAAVAVEPAAGLPGAACDADAACGGARCLKSAGGRAWPGGTCAADCTRQDRCPGGTACADFPGGGAWCALRCSTPGQGQGSCRAGYVCEDDGAGRGLCLPRCTAQACAILGRACDEASGHCADCGRRGERCCPLARGAGAAAWRCDEGACGAAGLCE